MKFLSESNSYDLSRVELLLKTAVQYFSVSFYFSSTFSTPYSIICRKCFYLINNSIAFDSFNLILHVRFICVPPAIHDMEIQNSIQNISSSPPNVIPSLVYWKREKKIEVLNADECHVLSFWKDKVSNEPSSKRMNGKRHREWKYLLKKKAIKLSYAEIFIDKSLSSDYVTSAKERQRGQRDREGEREE